MQIVRPEQICTEEESVKQFDWNKFSDIVNAQCPDSTPQSGEVYQRVWMRVWLTKDSKGVCYI
jgi:hypothetical protein